MQDHDRGLVIGETTFGKALVQSVYRISNGAGLALTTGRYYTPSGRLIQRPWDGTFDEYLTYSLRDQSRDAGARREGTEVHRRGPQGATAAAASSRITSTPARSRDSIRRAFSRQLLARGFFVDSPKRFTAEGDKRPGPPPTAKHKVARGFVVTPAMLAEFADYVAKQRVKVDAAALAADAAFISAMIHFEVDLDLFGVEEARRNFSKVDPQAQFALTFFGEAQRLIGAGAPSGTAAAPSPEDPLTHAFVATAHQRIQEFC